MKAADYAALIRPTGYGLFCAEGMIEVEGLAHYAPQIGFESDERFDGKIDAESEAREF